MTLSKNLLYRLWLHLTDKLRFRFKMLLILMLTTSMLEVISIGAFIPFLGALTNPSYVLAYSNLANFIKKMKIYDENDLILLMTILFFSAVLISGFIRILFLRISNNIIFSAGAELSQKIYRQTLYQSYGEFCKKSSSEAIDSIANKANNIIYLSILPVVTIINTSILVLIFFLSILAFKPNLAITIVGGFLIIYFLISFFVKNKLKKNGELLSISSTHLIKLIQEAYGGFRNITIDGLQETYFDRYKKSDLILRNAQAENLFLGTFPRVAVEVLGIILLTVTTYILTIRPGGIINALPLLGALALAAQRILPLLQQGYNAWTNIRSGQTSLIGVLHLLDQSSIDRSNINPDPIIFKKNIVLKNVTFNYENEGKIVFNKINLKISKGKQYGIIGETGAGKSTLVDLIMGLVEPVSGTLEVDNLVINDSNKKNWQARIAHVPQNIFLTDSSIIENIAFGVQNEKIDLEKVKKICRIVELYKFIENLPKKYNSMVGERGILVSGGQRQRIGIARALYKEADVIILDEATNALDYLTEYKIINAIRKFDQNLTILMISHKLYTLNNCNKILEVDLEGNVKLLNYEHLNNSKSLVNKLY